MTVRVGVIGTGNIGTSHARDLAARVAGSTVTVVTDVDEARAAALAAELGASAVPTAEALIASPDVDAIVIASPDEFHAEQALACLAAGKPTLCEKPLAPLADAARAVVDAEVALGRRLLMLGFMRRFDPGYEALRDRLGSDGIGDPLIIRNAHRNEIAPYGLDSALSITNAAIHEIDINRWLTGEDYCWVHVLTGRSGPITPQGQHDPLFLLLETTGGTIVEVEMFVQSQVGYEVTCDVTGGHGIASMGSGDFVTMTKDRRRGTMLPAQWLGRFQDAYRRQLQAWVTSIIDGQPAPGATAWDGYLATLTATCAVQSLRSNTRVDIELPVRPALYA